MFGRLPDLRAMLKMNDFQNPVESMEQDERAEEEQHVQTENNVMNRLAALEAMVNQLTAQRTQDWQTISNLQQQQGTAQTTIDQQAQIIANLQRQYTQEAIEIDQHQYERRMEKKAEKTGNTFHPHRNDSKKQKNRKGYVAKYNDTEEGPMDIDYTKERHKGKLDKKFKGTCHFCGKTGKDCYCKQNKGKQSTSERPIQPEKAKIDMLQEVPHDTACYDDSCLTHKSSKEGSGYYPKKPKKARTIQNARIDMINFREKEESEYGNNGITDEDMSNLITQFKNWTTASQDKSEAYVVQQNSDYDTECEFYGLTEPMHKCNPYKYTPDNYFKCDLCVSTKPRHECKRCPKCGSMVGYRHKCEAEFKANQKAMWEITQNEEPPHNEHSESDGKYDSHEEKQGCMTEDEWAQEMYRRAILNIPLNDDECSLCGNHETHDCWKYKVKLCSTDNAPSALKEIMAGHWNDKTQTYTCTFCGSNYTMHTCPNWDYLMGHYKCCLCNSPELEHDCMGCGFCKSMDPEHCCFEENKKRLQYMNKLYNNR